jgi:hypothetical protein
VPIADAIRVVTNAVVSFEYEAVDTQHKICVGSGNLGKKVSEP